ncbi:MAG: DUF4325 domain-containing protein, partial [Acidobacteria bacterium]|nr:DUF4325 domain-containing protein [Acidobacteriota bacterium]
MLAEHFFDLPVDAAVKEDEVWRSVIVPLLTTVNEDCKRISQYGFTEILNNALVHSEGHAIAIATKLTPIELQLHIWDDGIGIYNKLKRDLHLDDERHAILELAKGKVTTNPTHHTGEGIFFTSRAADTFSLCSENIALLHDTESGDWLLDNTDFGSGTYVRLAIDTKTNRSLKAVFDRYTSGEEEYGFTRTIVPVFLAKYGDENLISRSQANRLVARFERFKEVILDFDNVSSIGQA